MFALGRRLAVLAASGTAAALIAMFPAAAQADPAQAARIAAISYAETEKGFPTAPIVEPVAVSGGYALADWVAGLRQGEVLLVRDGKRWRVLAFEKSSLADAGFLTRRYAVPPATARALVRALRAAQALEGAAP